MLRIVRSDILRYPKELCVFKLFEGYEWKYNRDKSNLTVAE